MTIETKEDDKLFVQWKNDIPIADGYLITGKCQYKENSTVDESLHWAYSLHDYKNRTIADDGTPIVPHFHGGHTAATSDGNPEYFFSPGWKVRGPLWGSKVYEYANDQPAATNWYHDHVSFSECRYKPQISLSQSSISNSKLCACLCIE